MTAKDDKMMGLAVLIHCANVCVFVVQFFPTMIDRSLVDQEDAGCYCFGLAGISCPGRTLGALEAVGMLVSVKDLCQE